ncbi:MAG TPA: hypothetical protein PKC30_04510 [Saprospiraceae bacterium]|nr:hypothetical protein [Saprospiraceae bacterium]
MKLLINFWWSIFVIAVCAHAQSNHPRWQLEISWDYVSHGGHYAQQVLYTDFTEIIVANSEKTTFYIAATHLSALSGKLFLRYGLSLSDKGYIQDFSFINPNVGVYWEWIINRQLYFLGTPVLLSYNTYKKQRKWNGYIEAGLIPELLISNKRGQEIPVFNNIEYRFKSMNLSGMLSGGIQFKITDSLTFRAGPQFRWALFEYSKGTLTLPSHSIVGFRPVSIGFSGGVLF